MKLDKCKIQVILAEKEMNQTDLAVKIGVSRQQINELLSRGTCTLKTLSRLAKALGVPVAEIVKEES